MLAISSLAELYLLLVTTWKLEGVKDENLVALKKISSILTQLAHHYKFFTEPAVYHILASCCRFFESTSFSQANISSTDWDVHTERIVRSTCLLLCKELETSLTERRGERTRQILPSLLCLAVTLGATVGRHSQGMWRSLVAQYHIASQLIEAAAAALQVKELSDSSLLMLELLSVLTEDDEWSFRQVDILELHTAWDSLKPPIQNLFGPVPVCLEEKSLFEATNWFPVYKRALNLVSALVAHSCPSTRELGFDFLYQHEKFICDIFEFKDDSLKEPALELVSAALRLLWHVTQAVVPWNWKLKSTLARILVKVKQYVATLVDLLGDPSLLLKRKADAGNHKTFPPPPELKGKDMHTELQYLQNRLVGMLIECLSVLKEVCPLHSDLLTADRLGLPIYRLRLLVEPRAPAEAGPEYHTLINITNLVAKRLASNLRISPRSSSSQSGLSAGKSPAVDGSKTKANDETGKELASPPQSGGKDDTYFAAKLSSCSQSDLKLLLELTVHYMISNTLLTILSDQMGFHQSIIFLRDISTEAKTFLEYAQRLSYGKDEITNWKSRHVDLGNYKPLTWDPLDKNEMEDSVSLGCVPLPDSDTESAASTSRRSASPDPSRDQSKRLKVTQVRVPASLQHFLPPSVEFDLDYEPKDRDEKKRPLGDDEPSDEESTELILFCNHMLKQMFGMHGFDERSLRSAC